MGLVIHNLELLSPAAERDYFIYGLSANIAEQRTKEIGISKVELSTALTTTFREGMITKS